jgi:hypothetical protein
MALGIAINMAEIYLTTDSLKVARIITTYQASYQHTA